MHRAHFFKTITLVSVLQLSVITAPLAASETAQKIAKHFASVKTMAGEFVQFGPKGGQSGGKFFIDRPGKLRFNYDKPSTLRVISDGKAVAIGNRALKTWDVYPLSRTPLKILLSDKFSLKSKMVKSVQETADLTTIVLGDKKLFGNSKITLMFDPGSFELKQWTMSDAQGKETSVVIYNVKTGLKFGHRVFKIPDAALGNNHLNDK